MTEIELLIRYKKKLLKNLSPSSDSGHSLRPEVTSGRPSWVRQASKKRHWLSKGLYDQYAHLWE